MQTTKPKKRTKTFPLEIEDGLHKALKFRAIEEDKTLHSLIIETLSARIQETPPEFRTGQERSSSK